MFMFWKSQHNRVLILLKLIYKFNAISIKISTRFFVDIHKIFKNLYEKANGLEFLNNLEKEQGRKNLST